MILIGRQLDFMLQIRNEINWKKPTKEGQENHWMCSCQDAGPEDIAAKDPEAEREAESAEGS